MSESLSCNFYKYTGDPRVANKNLGSAIYTCSSIKPLEPLSDLDIKLIIDYPYHVENFPNSGDQSTYPSEGSQVPAVMGANYVAIDNLYYKITNKERLPANGLAIYATIDGLLSYWTEVSGCPCVCERSSTIYNSDIKDSKYPVLQKYDIQTKHIQTLDNADYIVFGIVE